MGGFIYLIKDDIGLKIGSSKEGCIDNRIKSVMRNRGTGTCRLIGVSKEYNNYLNAERWIRDFATIKYNLPIHINEWHNFKDKDSITEELLKNLLKLLNSYVE